MILLNLFAVTLALLDALHDSLYVKELNATTFENKSFYSKRWHQVDAVIKGMIAIYVGYLFIYPQSDLMPKIVDVACVAVLVLLWRLLLFNYAFNKFLELPVNHYSNKSLIDRITNKYIPRSFVNIFIAFVIICINVYLFQF